MEMAFTSIWQVRFMFAFYAIGLLLLSLNFIGLYYYALRESVALDLRQHELFDTKGEIVLWSAASLVCTLSLGMALVLPDNLISLSGYVFFLLFPVLTGVGVYLGRKRNRLFKSR
jgi:hypothetical protein